MFKKWIRDKDSRCVGNRDKEKDKKTDVIILDKSFFYINNAGLTYIYIYDTELT